VNNLRSARTWDLAHIAVKDGDQQNYARLSAFIERKRHEGLRNAEPSWSRRSRLSIGPFLNPSRVKCRSKAFFLSAAISIDPHPRQLPDPARESMNQ
jgi:hypothetical protein